MCTRLRSTNGVILTPGLISQYVTLSGQRSGMWGFEGGKIYNARVERLEEYWRRYKDNRGIIPVLCFYEKGYEISLPAKIIHLPLIYNEFNQFSVLTTESKGLLKHIHHRSPIILDNDPKEWIELGVIREFVISKTA